MLREHSKIIDQLTQVADMALITLAFFMSHELYRQKGSVKQTIETNYLIVYVLYALTWLIVANANNLFASRRMTTWINEMKRLTLSHVISIVVSLTLLPLLFRGLIHDRFTFYFAAFAYGLTAIFHLFTRLGLKQIRRLGLNRKYVLILGSSQAGSKLVKKLRKHPSLGYQIIGYIDTHQNGLDVTYCGDYSQIEKTLTNNVVDVVIVAGSIHDPDIRLGVELAHVMGKTTVALMDDEVYQMSRMRPFQMAGMTMVAMYSVPHYEWQELAKKLLDVVVSGLGLVVASPLMLAISIGIRLTSKGPVFFKQERVGLNGRKFKMYKFRSMVQDAEELKAKLAHLNEMSGPVFKIKDDPRVTSIGHFLRKTSLDELPQLWNVFRQDMSLVGPRPPLPSEVNLYDPKHRKRLSVKPGITCIWQISGRNDVDFDQWMEMDAEYVDNWSLALDMKILVKTVPVVLGRKGAS